MNQPREEEQIYNKNLLHPTYGRKNNIVKVTTSPSTHNPDDEPDPDLLERYDNFYQTTKSLLVLFQIMGVMPIERAGKGKTTFRYCNLFAFPLPIKVIHHKQCQ